MLLTCCRNSHNTHSTLAPAHTTCLFSIDMHTVRQHLVITCFLSCLSGILSIDVSCVHHFHYVSLVLRHTCFIQLAKTELCSLYTCACFSYLIHFFFFFLPNVSLYAKNAFMFVILLKSFGICFHCLPISMPLHY